MLQHIHLKGVGPAPELDLEFAPRLNLLTGDNGLGKSFVLDIGWWALTGTWAGQQAWPREEAKESSRIDYRILGTGLFSAEGDEVTASQEAEGIYDFSQEKWRTEEKPPPVPSVVLYARVDGSFSVWDSARNDPGKPWANEISRWPPLSLSAYHFSPEALWDGLSENGRVLCEGLIRDWVSWQRQRADSFQNLREILKVLSPSPEEELRPGEPMRISLEDVRDHPTLEMPYGRVPLILASAGMKRIINLTYLLVWAWREHLEAAKLLRRPPADRIVFLIDEIESHLHPKWQRLILPSLLNVADRLKKGLNVQIFVSTHAPLVLASAEPLFDDEKDALFTFDLEGRDVKVSRADWRDRGDASAWLTSDVFDLEEARSVQAEQAIQQAKEAMRDPDLPVEEKRRIHHELHAVLKDTDPFWGRWLVQAKAAGIEP